jgi:hypothetical protein
MYQDFNQAHPDCIDLFGFINGLLAEDPINLPARLMPVNDVPYGERRRDITDLHLIRPGIVDIPINDVPCRSAGHRVAWVTGSSMKCIAQHSVNVAMGVYLCEKRFTMVTLNGITVWSYEGYYGLPFVGLNQQKMKIKAMAKELSGVAIDPRTNLIIN